MKPLRPCAAFVAMFALTQAAMAEGPAWKTFPIDDYQSFVVNWPGEGAPLCAALSSSEQWDRVMHPAATMFNRKPFAPPAGFWKDHAVLLVAKVVDYEPGKPALKITGVSRTASTVAVDYAFTPPPRASSQIKGWAAIQVDKPLPPTVTFAENGREVCAVKADGGAWVSPTSVLQQASE